MDKIDTQAATIAELRQQIEDADSEFSAQAAAYGNTIDKLRAELAGVRAQGQREGKAAVCGWLRELSATKPPASLHHAALMLADQFEASEQPCDARALASEGTPHD